MGDVVVGTKLIRNFLLRELALRRWLEQILVEDLNPAGGADEGGNQITIWDNLKDGVLLCRVMLTLKPNSVPKIHEEKAVFRRKENLFFFLEALDEHDFPAKKKFTVADLYEEKNLIKVLECIEELAKIAVLEWNFYFKLKSAGEIEEELGMTEGKLFTDVDKARAVRILTRHLQETSKRAQRNFSSVYIPATKRVVASKAKLVTREAASTYGIGAGTIIAASLGAQSSGERSSSLAAIASEEFSSLKDAEPSSPRSQSPRKPLPPLPSPRSQAPSPPSQEPDASSRRVTVVSIDEGQEKGKEKVLELEDGEISPRSVIVITLSPQEEEILMRGVVKLQALLRGRLARVKYRKKLRNAAYRESVAREIEKTEQDYVDNLRLLSEVFLEPLRKELESKDEALEGFKGVFADIQVIRNYNGKMLNDIKPRIAKWHPNQSLGDIFLQVAAFLKAYTQYVTKYNKAIAHITGLKKQMPKFRQFLEECAEKANGQDIAALLIQPVQRIPRYQLLLKDLISHSDPEHLDYESLGKAAEKIREVAVYIEKRCEEAENITKVSEIQSRLFGKIDNLAQASRKYVRQGEMVVWSLENKKKENRVVILFNDLLLETKPMVKKGRKGEPDLQVLKYLHSWNLYHVSPAPMPDTERDKFGLALTSEGGKTALVRLYAKSAFERDDWVRAFQALRSDIEAKRSEHYERVRDTAQSKAARYKETIEGRYTSPILPEDSMIARSSTVSSRWESRLRAHTARIRQIQAQSGEADASLSLPSPPRQLNSGEVEAILDSGSPRGVDSGAFEPPEVNGGGVPDAKDGGRKGTTRGRHTITEGMVKAESPSLFSRLFLRKRSKARPPLPHYSSSVRSLKTQISISDLNGVEASSSSSSSSSHPADSGLGSSVSCADCVPSPRIKQRQSYLREEKKVDDKEKGKGRRASKEKRKSESSTDSKRSSRSSIGKSKSADEKESGGKDDVRGTRPGRSLSTSSSAATHPHSDELSSSSSGGKAGKLDDGIGGARSPEVTAIIQRSRRRKGSNASEVTSTDDERDEKEKAKEKRREKKKARAEKKAAAAEAAAAAAAAAATTAATSAETAEKEEKEKEEPQQNAGTEAAKEDKKARLKRKMSAQRLKEAMIQKSGSSSSLFQRIVTATPSQTRSGSGSAIEHASLPQAQPLVLSASDNAVPAKKRTGKKHSGSASPTDLPEAGTEEEQRRSDSSPDAAPPTNSEHAGEEERAAKDNEAAEQKPPEGGAAEPVRKESREVAQDREAGEKGREDDSRKETRDEDGRAIKGGSEERHEQEHKEEEETKNQHHQHHNNNGEDESSSSSSDDEAEACGKLRRERRATAEEEKKSEARSTSGDDITEWKKEGGMLGKRVNSELRLETTSNSTFTKEVRQRELGHLRSIRMHSFRSTRSKWEQKQREMAAAAAAAPAVEQKPPQRSRRSKPEDQLISPTTGSTEPSSADTSPYSSPASSTPSSPRSSIPAGN